MTSLSIKPIDPVSRPFFGGEVSGVDLTRPLSWEQAAAIEAAMDQYGVLVFHDQRFTDETQLAFSRNFGELETASGELTFGQKRRIESDYVNDISNLDLENRVRETNDRKRLFGLGNRLWPSDSSFKQVPAKFSLLFCLMSFTAKLSRSRGASRRPSFFGARARVRKLRSHQLRNRSGFNGKGRGGACLSSFRYAVPSFRSPD